MDLEDENHMMKVILKASAMVLAPGDRHVVIGFEVSWCLCFVLISSDEIL